MKRGLGKGLISLGVDLAVGAVVTDALHDEGDGLLSAIGAGAAGMGAGIGAQVALNALDRETGIVSDVGSLVDDVFDIF